MGNPDWAQYARLQSMLNSTTNAYKAAGIEAAMDDLLEKFARGVPCTSEQTTNLVINRIGKERRHRGMLFSRQHDLAPGIATAGLAESRLTLGKCAKVCGPRDFKLLVNRACGWSYSELANATGVNQNTLKTRVHRVRQKLRLLAAKGPRTCSTRWSPRRSRECWTTAASGSR